MGLSQAEAIELAVAWAGPQHVLSGAVLETSYGWVFELDVAEAFSDVIGRYDEVVVERDTGRVFPVGDLHHGPGSYEALRRRTLDAFDAGLRFYWYDLTIEAVADLTETISGLSSLAIRFVVPEFLNGDRFTIPRSTPRPISWRCLRIHR